MPKNRIRCRLLIDIIQSAFSTVSTPNFFSSLSVCQMLIKNCDVCFVACFYCLWYCIITVNIYICNSIDCIFRHYNLCYKQTYPSVDVIFVVFVFSIEGFVPVPRKCVLGTGWSFRTGKRDTISCLGADFTGL